MSKIGLCCDEKGANVNARTWRTKIRWSLALLLLISLLSEVKILYYIVPDFFEERRPEVQFLNENADLERVLGLGATVQTLHERGFVAWGLYGIGNANYLGVTPSYDEFFRDYLNPAHGSFLSHKHVMDTPEANPISTFALDMLGVKYLLLPDFFINYITYFEEQGFIEVAHFPASAVKIFENPNVWPRAFLISTEHLPNESELMLKPELRSVLSEVDIKSYHHVDLAIQGYADYDGIVVLTDNWHRNWKAELNGVEADIIKVHGTFRGVYVPAGDFELTMSYRPSTFSIALVLTGFGVAFCLLGLIIPKRLWIYYSKKILVIGRQLRIKYEQI